MSEIVLPKPMGSSYSAFIWSSCSDVYKTLPHIIYGWIGSGRQKKRELSIFIMDIYSWNYKNQTPIDNSFTYKTK